ncbi:MAG TPA: ATP synthase F0 subunit C [Candidatus Acidoferrales bacterium]|nr:ATP synthase F0 subunit C [Candidatus Acidoferrales bacterium]HEV2488668.1 ATP synthase F0 subunit C [Candidatus Acidoferrales bacterium]
MTKKAAWILLIMVVMLVIAPAAFAQTGASPAASAIDWVDVAAAIGLGIAAAGCGVGQGKATASACEGTARNPGAAGPIRNAFIIGVALIESLTLYALVVVFLK